MAGAGPTGVPSDSESEPALRLGRQALGRRAAGSLESCPDDSVPVGVTSQRAVGRRPEVQVA